MSNRVLAEGTHLVKALNQTLNGLREDVDLLEFLRLVQHSVVAKNNSFKYQTPQIAVSQHIKLTFLKRYDQKSYLHFSLLIIFYVLLTISTNPRGAVQNDVTEPNTSNIIPGDRMHFYRWTLNYNQFLRRGRALVFSQSMEDETTRDSMEKLKLLEYDPEWKPLTTMNDTLESGEQIFFLKYGIKDFLSSF
jgi:hypothetical protein